MKTGDYVGARETLGLLYVGVGVTAGAVTPTFMLGNSDMENWDGTHGVSLLGIQCKAMTNKKCIYSHYIARDKFLL